MPAKRFREESGYSLVEVMVSIMIFTLAILPMAAMFNMGIHASTASSNYDKSRMLANQKLEQAKNLPFVDVESNFPQAGITTPYDGTGVWLTEPGEDFTSFQYSVKKDYMAQPPMGPADGLDPSEDFDTCPPPCEPPTGLIRVTVTVGWGGDSDGDGSPDKTITTSGLVAQ
jgi:hypothetical protein